METISTFNVSSTLPHWEGQGVDLLIIGAGPGGYRAAEYAAQNGLQVTIVEQDEVGGTCLNEGCIPTKCYVHDAGRADFAAAFERKNSVVQQLRSGVEGILSHPNITLLRGKASFVDSQTVCVSGDTVAVKQTVAAKNIIIATGSMPKQLPCGTALSSTDLLQLDHLPQSLCIVGAGVIGMEFASIFNAFGVEVTVVEYMKECLPMLDSDIAKRLRKVMEKRGITFYMQSEVKEVCMHHVLFERKGNPQTVEADCVLVAVGRAPRLPDGIELAGVTLDHRGNIVVDDNYCCVCRDNVAAKIYAIGDVNGRCQLAHAAEMQAARAVNHILGKQDGIRFDVMPAAIFTEPEAACVGLSEDQCKAQGLAYKVGKAFHRANGKALAMGETEGMVKLLYSAQPLSGEDPLPLGKGGVMGSILGCHAFGAHSADIVQEVAALMCCNTTVEQLRDIVHIHPTLSELLLDAAR